MTRSLYVSLASSGLLYIFWYRYILHGISSFALPADGFRCWSESRRIAVLEGGVTEQWSGGGPAEWSHPVQLPPCALGQVLLSVLRVRKRIVKKYQHVLTELVPTHVASVCAAVACAAFVQSKSYKTSQCNIKHILCGFWVFCVVLSSCYMVAKAFWMASLCMIWVPFNSLLF